MSKKSFAFIFVLAVMLGFASCNPAEKYKAEIKTLDSLSVLIDSAQLKLTAIDTLKIQQFHTELTAHLDSIEKNNRDTVSREIALLLMEYSSLQKAFKKINSEYSMISNELKASKEQIINLVHDLKIGKVDESKVGSYVQNEKIAATNVIQSAEVMSEMAKLSSEKFEIDQPRVLKFINEIKAKQELKK